MIINTKIIIHTTVIHKGINPDHTAKALNIVKKTKKVSKSLLVNIVINIAKANIIANPNIKLSVIGIITSTLFYFFIINTELEIAITKNIHKGIIPVIVNIKDIKINIGIIKSLPYT